MVDSSYATEVLTANRGWIEMVEIKVGDMVIHPSGQPTRVEFVSDVINAPCYEVLTTDGRSVVVDAEHPWAVTDKRTEKSRGATQRTRWFVDRIATTEQMVTEGLSRYLAGYRTTKTDGKIYTVNEYRFQLPEQNSIQMPEQELLPIDPYLLGTWLGDGHSSGAQLTSHVDDVPHWVNQIERCGFIASAKKQKGKPNAFGIGIHPHHVTRGKDRHDEQRGVRSPAGRPGGRPGLHHRAR